MSSIPYNYGKYVDDTVKLRDQGHVDAGRQVQSPASAGSRGLNKTVQFTKDPTQMKMGESITMEDMKSLISRIDGLNVPTNEAPKDSDIDYTKLMLDISAMKDRIAELPIDDDRKTSALTALGQVEDDLAMDESAVQEDDNSDYIKQAYMLAVKHHTDGSGDGNINEDIGDLIEDYNEKADKKISPEQIMSISKKYNAGGDYVEVLSAEGIDGKLWLEVAKEYYAQLESYQPFPEADEMTFEDDDAFYEAFGELGFPEDETELFDAEYRGRKVPLNKPMRGDVKKFKVYVKDPKTGNVKKVNFGHGGSSARKAGQKTMKIRKSNPKARKSFRARHNCANPGPKTKARYWSCRKW